jgi:hypothetical protein
VPPLTVVKFRTPKPGDDVELVDVAGVLVVLVMIGALIVISPNVVIALVLQVTEHDGVEDVV